MAPSNAIPLGFVSSDQAGAVVAVSLLITTITILLFKLSKHGHGRRSRAPGLPPGPLGLPLLGCLPFLDPCLHRYFAGLARSYGPVLSLRLGTQLFVVVSSPSAAREVLKDNDLIFVNHPVPAAVRALHDWHHDLVFSPYGPVWRALRKVCVRDLLSQSNLELIRPPRRREVRRAVVGVLERVGEPVQVLELTLLATLDMMTRMLWGGTSTAKGAGANEYDIVTKELVEVVEGIVATIGAPNISDFVPALAALDLQGLGRRMKRLMARFEKLIDKLVQQTMTASSNSSGTEAAKKRTFLQVLLEIMERGDPQAPLNMDNVRGLILNMLTGSTHTTSTTMEWAIAELLHRPDAMAQVHEELDATVGIHRAVEESDICNLPYLDAVVKETLRLHPVVPLLIPHTPSSSCVVGGFTIPKGTSVFTNVWAIQRDPSLWEDPDEFKPERFLKVTTVDGRITHAAHDGNDGGNDFSYLPFGFGRRICVGAAFAETTTKFMLASLLHAFEWHLPAGVELDLAEKFELVLTKAKPLVAVPKPRLEETGLYYAYL